MTLAKANLVKPVNHPKYWIALPRALNEHGQMKNRARNLAAAEESWKAAWDFHKNLHTQAIDPRNELKQNVANVCNHLGGLYRDTRRLEEADAAFAEALRVASILVSRHGMNAFYISDKSTALFGVATLKNLRGQFAEAEPLLNESILLRQILHRKSPQMVYERHALMNAQAALARSLLEQKKLPAAAEQCKQATALIKLEATDSGVGLAVLVQWCRIGMTNDAVTSGPAFDAALEHPQDVLHDPTAARDSGDAVANGESGSLQGRRAGQPISRLRVCCIEGFP